jgi:hypothetical protein
MFHRRFQDSRFNLANFLPGFRCNRLAAWVTRV